MLKELFEAICRNAVIAAQPRTFKIDEQPSHVAYVTKPASDGTVGYEEIVCDPAPRNHKANSIADMAAIVSRYCGFKQVSNSPDIVVRASQESKFTPPTAVLWYSCKGLTFVYDDATRRDTASLSLAISGPLQTLGKLEQTPKKMKQFEFIDFLNLNFRNTASPSAEAVQLVTLLRKLQFLTQTQSTGNLQTSQRSIGKSLEAQVSVDAGSLPDELSLVVPVFTDAVTPVAQVRCLLTVDPTDETFSLRPFAGEYDRAVAEGTVAMGTGLREQLRDVDVTILGGTP